MEFKSFLELGRHLLSQPDDGCFYVIKNVNNAGDRSRFMTRTEALKLCYEKCKGNLGAGPEWCDKQ